ncbi:CAP-Gly domain-containing linker protein 1-like isoform X11 [Adelges cooleyi]|uniref:CAP-Gly domain-containing linker protein 1-like isoform X11 n=1 Tax=Adelges cooleyi TaxID=133065 RepID=UPI00217F8804|nr:CAP-Gly domain-containing linker protein 1-like isoform X11 [Adelges cooleyi]
MSENPENKEIKSSGLKPPTKIPTMGVSRIPSSSSIKLDGYHSTVTKLNGGPSNAKRLADIPYTGKQNGVSKEERKSSSGSDYSMGDSRRLSEAGVRRSSGNSVVLTEDTDSFIIGDRVWVGGTKPGQIAYIGETNFGTGDWAGIVLDEPIGKNDGSVGGTKYFQCSPKKGIFARLTNLTNAPLGSAEDSIVQSSFAKAKPLGFSTPMPKRQTSNVTAPVSTAAVQRSVVKNVNQTPASRGNSELKVGDRVIISSGQGSKLGVLRYRGAAQFAPGEWCGIELDDPLGKNNGSVEGIKYFECEDKFGLFAPIGKVSKSPMSASRMSSNCAIHKTNKRSPGSMSGSMISGVTATTMSSIPTRVRLGVASLRYKQTKVSDLDKLKTQLTQLKNENELLRLQVTKAANQADVAEKQLEETLKAQIAKSSQDNSLLTLQSQLDTLKKQLDDEREKFQNLQFTIEEQNVANVELQNKNGELLIKIKEQEADLEKERNLAKDVEVETMKNFEKEEELCRLKEELDSLKKVINNNEDELQKSVSNLSTEVIDKDALLNTLRQQLNESTQNHERVLKETSEKLASTTERLNKVIEEKDKKIEQNQEMIDQLNEGIKSLSALKNEEHDEIVNGLKNEITKLKDEHKSVFDQNERDVKKAIEQHELMVKELNDKLDGLSDTKSQEISRLQEKYNDALRLQSADQQTIANLKLELNATVDSLNQLKINNFIFSKDVLEAALKQQMESAMVTVTHLEHQFAKAVVITDKQIKTCNTAVLQIKEQIVKSKAQTETLYEDKLREKEGEIEILTKKLNELTDIVEQREIGNKELNDQLTKALKTAEEKSNQIIELEKKYNDLDTQQNLTRNELEKEMAGQLKTLKDELEDIKLKKSAMQEEHEKYVREMVNSIGVKEEQLNDNKVVIENLKSSLADLQTAKQNDLDAQSERLAQIENEKQENFKRHNSELTVRDEQIKTLSNQLTNVVEQHKIANKELNDQLTKALKTAEEKSNQIIELEKKFNDLDTQQNLSRNELEKELAGQLKTLNDELADLKTKKITMQEEHEKYVKETVNSISVKEEQLNANKIIIENFKSSLAELETAKQNDLDAQSKRLAQLENEKQENLKRHDSELIARDEQIKTLSDQLEQTLNEKQKQHSSYSDLQKTLNTEISNYQNEIDQLRDQINDLQSMIALDGDKASDEIELSRKELENIKSENTKLLDALKTLEHEKTTLEHQLELIGTLEKDVKRLNEEIEEKSKTIAANDSKIEHISEMAKQADVVFNNKLKAKDDEIERLFKVGEDKLVAERSTLEKQTKLILEEKEKENAGLREKLSELYDVKIGLEKQLEISKTHELQVNTLNETVQEKMKTIAENNAKIDELNDLVTKVKHDFEVSTKEKNNRINEVLKGETEKLELEKIVEQYKMSMDEKDREIVELKNCLQEVAGKKTEKELILRLESVNTDLEKEKTRAVNLESLKCDLEKKISEYKKDLNSMEETKTEMSKSLDKQREHNTEQINHIKSEVLLLNDENLKVKSEMEDYKSKLSALQKTLNDKNQETETLKLLLSEKSTSNSEMERLETLLEKQCGNREHLEFRIQELTDENHRLNERIENIGKPLQDNNLINEKQKLEVKYEETYSMLKIKENHILVLQTELNSYKLKDIAKVKNHNVQEKSDAHILAEKNEEVKMLNSIILSLHKKLSAVMETDVSDYEIDKNPNGLTKEEYQKLYKTAKNNVKLKECENMTLQQEISKLKAENDRFAEYKTKCDSLEKDKKKLQQIVVNNESSRDGDNNKTGTKSETAKILEEKDWQINLLNNIIADLHAKVSDNKFKMESLEKQILDSGSGQNKKARIRTARLYCEQCEIFDAHDTEDCPEKPESPKFQKKHRIVNNDNDDTLVEEPFCVCCDMFGHTANECDSSLTF